MMQGCNCSQQSQRAGSAGSGADVVHRRFGRWTTSLHIDVILLLNFTEPRRVRLALCAPRLTIDIVTCQLTNCSVSDRLHCIDDSVDEVFSRA